MDFTVDLEITSRITRCSISEAAGHQATHEKATAPDRLGTLLACIKAGASEFDCSVSDLLKNTAVINLKAPELITDTLTNKNGTQMGLIVSQSHEKKVYDANNGHHPVWATILAQDLVVGVEEETNARGEQIFPPREVEVQEKMSYLLNLGCGIIAVSLKHATLNPANEIRLKEIARADYPRHYLGAVPILISSDFSDEQDEAIRTDICLLNAYTWFTLDQFLRRVESSLRQNGYTRRLKVVQTDGQAVPITRVTPLKTCSPDQMVSLNQFIGAAGAM